MQLNKSLSFSAALSAAASALLVAPVTSVKAEESNAWKLDSAVMYYGETDRVQAVEVIVGGKKEFEDGHFLDLKFTFDTLTGASATGAVAQPNIQSFTRPSGNGRYTVSANETPLDDTFKDTRVQLNAQWTQPLKGEYTLSTGAHLSKEYDYLSLGINAGLAREFNQKNTTVSAGLSLGQDTITPEGGLPIPLYEMPHYINSPNGQPNNTEGSSSDFDASRDRSSDSKQIVDLLFGVTQVINRRFITQFNYSYSNVDGYQTDPFKVVSVVDENGVALNNIYESRPDKRQKNSVYAQGKYHLSKSVVDVSYRYFWDDWGIKSNSIDAKYWMPMGKGYLEPHIRYYQQDEADFYQPFVTRQPEVDSNVSADYRIGKLTGLTLGLSYGFPLNNGHEISFRAELYRQKVTDPGVNNIGVINQLDIFPDVDAVIFQTNYSF
ncbi:DUF3570 domain-containing protein [Psychrosphaera sp. 1_MG-2023]|uniref:DUF3570 domain-containing protein n=1 Tax=Psychrosphaera sp. 1_MG-2023 TaxID=3062643 RepID=UPI0026E3497C|nr:DUF3570 domain-containing protein [Psychrosphaera sp. 1_MG-2023]MDO6720298.1 DUF3570 domain-containing protein [Psychrosphaera sp. 1_MG-2023]